MKTNKRITGIIMVVFLITSYFIWSWINGTDPRFTEEKWMRHPNKRILIVDDYLTRYPLTGKTQKEIEESLGAPYNHSENQMRYYLGEDGLGIDGMILEINFNENGKVEGYAIGQS